MHREESSQKELCVNAAHPSSKKKKKLQKLAVKKAGGKRGKMQENK